MSTLSKFLLGRGTSIDIQFEFPLYNYDKAVQKFGHHELLRLSGTKMEEDFEIDDEIGRPMFVIDTMTFPKGFTREKLHKIIQKNKRYGGEIPFMCVDGFESDIVGVLFDVQLEFHPRLVYDVESMVRTLENGGMKEDGEAREYIDYNVLRAYCKEGTNPVFMETIF
jgi:hypothetical protein